MPDARTPTKRTEPLRLARTESMLEARPRPEVPGAEEMFLSPRVLDAGAFSRYAELLKSLIQDARQGARDLQDFAADADQMKAVCEKSGEQLRTRLEAGARVVKMIDERSDRAEKLIETARQELPTSERVRAMIEPAVRAALEAAQQRATEITVESERRARATATEIEQKLSAMSARAADQAARLERAGEAIEQRLQGLEARLSTVMRQAEEQAGELELRTKATVESAGTDLEPALRRVSDAAASIDATLAQAWQHAEARATQITKRLTPLQATCDAVIQRLGLDSNHPDPSGSLLDRLDGLVQRSEASVRGAEQVIGSADRLRTTAEDARVRYASWLQEATAQLDTLEARRERLSGPLEAIAEKVARVSPRIDEELEMASTRLDQLQTEQAILREAVQASAMLARGASSDLNNQSAQLKALIDGSVHTLTRRVEEAGQWLGELIVRAEAVAGRASTGAPRPVQSHPVQINRVAASPASSAAAVAPPSAAPQARVERTPDAPAAPRRPIEPPANSYGLPMPPALPIDAVSFDGADVVFGQGDTEGAD